MLNHLLKIQNYAIRLQFPSKCNFVFKDWSRTLFVLNGSFARGHGRDPLVRTLSLTPMVVSTYKVFYHVFDDLIWTGTKALCVIHMKGRNCVNSICIVRLSVYFHALLPFPELLSHWTNFPCTNCSFKLVKVHS